MVWKNSKRLGCAICAGREPKDNWPNGHETYVNCNYGPPGNYAGQFDQNVLRPNGKPNKNHLDSL